MKVEDPRAPVNTVTPTSADPARLGHETRVRRGADGVTLSPEIQLATEAVKAAATPVAIREEAVARARALVEQGAVGTDLERLADAILDSLIENHEPAP